MNVITVTYSYEKFNSTLHKTALYVALEPTLMDVLLSNLKDLVCPFSRYTFRTFGIKRRELSFTVS